MFKPWALSPPVGHSKLGKDPALGLESSDFNIRSTFSQNLSFKFRVQFRRFGLALVRFGLWD